jgi:benzoyl-CoA reductase subunit C
LEVFERTIKDRHQAVKDWKVKTGKEVFGYFCCVAPEEIIHAADILPIRITGSSSTEGHVDDHIPQYGCQFVRSAFDLAMSGVYDYLDGVVIPHTCDLVGRMEYWWRTLAAKRSPTIAGLEICPYVIYLNYPTKVDGEEALRLYRAELRQLRQYLERRKRIVLSDDRLRNSLEIYKEHFSLMERVHELRKEEPPYFSGYAAWVIEFSSHLMPKEEHSKILRNMLDNIGSRREKEKKVRLFFSGGALDQENATLYQIIEESGGQVVSEDVSCHTSFYLEDFPSRLSPLDAIASRALSVPCPRSTTDDPIPVKRWEWIKEKIKSWKVQGVILFNLNYCDCRALEYPLFKERILQTFGIPVLFLDGDYTREGLEQQRGKIETFVEMVRDRG